MEPAESEPLPIDETNQEYRVKVTSKKQVIDQLDKYKDILKTALDGQPDAAEETKRVLLQELLAVGQPDCVPLSVTDCILRPSRD